MSGSLCFVEAGLEFHFANFCTCLVILSLHLLENTCTGSDPSRIN